MASEKKDNVKGKPQKNAKKPQPKLLPIKSWQKTRRAARNNRGPWKGVFRDPVKLHLRGVVMSFRRSRLNIHPNRVLVKIEGVKTKQDARYYLGHRVLYIYRAFQTKDPRTLRNQLRVMAGKITGTHGNNGTVRVRFTPNLPARALGKRVRIMMWPHRAPN